MSAENISREMPEFAWTPEEELYRDFYCLSKDVSSIEAFRKKYADYPVWLENAMHPDSIPKRWTEPDYIKNDDDIALIRHPRFTPFYIHDHDYFEMVYVLKGSCIHTRQNEKEVLKEGDFYMLAPGVKHGLEVFDDSVVINLLVKKSTFAGVFSETLNSETKIGEFFLMNLFARKPVNYLWFQTGEDAEISNMVLNMFSEYESQQKYTSKILRFELGILFMLLSRSYESSLKVSKPQNRNEQLAQEILSYISAHYQDLSIEKLANHFGYSRAYCSKIVQEAVGYSYSELLQRIRMENAIRLLDQSRLPVHEISDQLGYKNTETFIRAFVRVFSITPAAWRLKSADEKNGIPGERINPVNEQDCPQNQPADHPKKKTASSSGTPA